MRPLREEFEELSHLLRQAASISGQKIDKAQIKQV